MFKIEHLNLTGEKVSILNKGNTILLSYSENRTYYIELHEKSAQSNSYQLIHKIMHDDCWGFIDFTMLSNEMIVTASWKTIIIYKKLNSSYKIDQKMYSLFPVF